MTSLIAIVAKQLIARAILVQMASLATTVTKADRATAVLWSCRHMMGSGFVHAITTIRNGNATFYKRETISIRVVIKFESF
jgi:hypothetical protein